MDQKVTVYVQKSAMNGNISDGGKTIALSKQLHIEYKQTQFPAFHFHTENMHFTMMTQADLPFTCSKPAK